jgi:hypothetical protein
MFKFSRLLIVYAIAVPLALILGYLVSSPDMFTFAAIGMLLFFLSLPLFLKWHHFLLIVIWNTAFNIFFLPGSPDAWLPMAALSFGISLLNHILFQKQFLHAPELTVPLLFLAAVVLVTAWYRGGIGIRALGGATYGGRYYLYILGAIIGYFAITAEQVPIAKSRKMADLFFLSGTTYALGNLVYVLGPAFYFMYYIVPSGTATVQASTDYNQSNLARIEGLGQACIAGFCFLLAHYGIRGLLDWEKPWRFVFLFITVGASFFAGFRSITLLLILIFAFQFYYEGLLRTNFLPVIIGFAIFGFTSILLFSDVMPGSVQRAISFLPVKVDSAVLADARDSSEWRFQIWADAWKEVPKYLLIGKGYGVDPTEIFLVNEANRMGLATSGMESQLLTGDYHSGPLSVLIPFGVFGVIGFLWVLIGGYRILSWNRRFGDTRLRPINTVLLAFYVAYTVSFFFIFGAFNSELCVFLGVCGLSVSLNGGVRRRAAPKRKPIPVQKTLAMEAG